MQEMTQFKLMDNEPGQIKIEAKDNRQNADYRKDLMMEDGLEKQSTLDVMNPQSKNAYSNMRVIITLFCFRQY